VEEERKVRDIAKVRDVKVRSGHRVCDKVRSLRYGGMMHYRSADRHFSSYLDLSTAISEDNH
jgi:hypothetical protein